MTKRKLWTQSNPHVVSPKVFFFSLCLFLSWLTTLLSVDHFTISGPPMKRRIYTNWWRCLGCIIFSCLGHQYSCMVTILNLRWSKGDFTQRFVVFLWLFVSLRQQAPVSRTENQRTRLGGPRVFSSRDLSKKHNLTINFIISGP